MIYVCVFCTNFTFSVWLRRKLSQKGKKKRKKKEKGRYLKLVVLASENLANFSGDKENRREF